MKNPYSKTVQAPQQHSYAQNSSASVQLKLTVEVPVNHPKEILAKHILETFVKQIRNTTNATDYLYLESQRLHYQNFIPKD
ncbi:MAG: hypothetical protein K2X66_11310 [Cyanobacteria bacterium]|nr:hypothetical protein [Cyanobacteriota bacterium]